MKGKRERARNNIRDGKKKISQESNLRGKLWVIGAFLHHRNRQQIYRKGIRLNRELSSLKASFQDGIKKIAGKLTSLGVPTSNTASPDTISNNIQTLYNNRYNEGISAAAIQTRDVVASTDNFGNYNDYNLTRSLKFNPPSLSGYRIVGAYIKKIYISNSNKAFGSGTFEIQKNGNSYYILSKDCNWPSGGTAVNATMTFIYQK